MTDTRDEEVVSILNRIVDQVIGNEKGMGPQGVQILAAYASYKAMDMVTIKLQEANVANAGAQAATLRELREQAKSTNRLVEWTAALAIGTLILGLTSIAALLLQHL